MDEKYENTTSKLVPIRPSKFIEQVPDYPPSGEPLSDEDLIAGGLVPVKTWFRTNKTKAALRVAKHREKNAVLGLKPVNVVANAETEAVIKQLAAAAKAGKTAKAAILELAGPEIQLITADLEKEKAKSVIAMTDLGLLKRELADIKAERDRLRAWKETVRKMALLDRFMGRWPR
ncbi:hypothetical protein [Sulfurirhabdus autotrophica]|uniref:Uncharacterized protein n=1 Tax=Sulfurirhabdus autotrophica TaxID=1706046 RepID=A0A4R3XTJ7_9PROT|nr:hypothetical protein [Sulfurirhabdus autotrophica]TCV81257.1 hypothetical protein EDC63_1245 [Sulfurirhabdus autotrophica]